MNKIVKFLGCIALGAFVLTSCVKNEESDGVKALRDAKAREINADAADQEIANLKSELSYLQDKAKWDASKDLQIQIEIAEKQADLVAKQIALYKAEAGVDNDKILAIKTELDEIRGEIETINGDLYGSNGVGGGLVVTNASITNTMTANRATIAANNKTIADLNVDPETNAAAIAALRAANALLAAENTALQAQFDENEAIITSKGKEIEALQKRLDTLIAEIGKF